ncbi:MAG: hypothetical protein COV76_05650 [Candidatus Omnitrophica bacterium CG11_big_fil_rev_8_21_14_0_20_64_10]|nr:MAG: hypothetical protein COV76_05650 [Candidatus Omnitrophica bacterium CG11_big_fil_rev_8_21_14_0_20_64_10]
MGYFGYVTRTSTGKSEKGTIEAGSRDEAVSLLQGRDLIVISLQEVRGGGGAGSGTTARPMGRKQYNRVTSGDLIIFARSLAAMTEAGLPLLGGLEVVASQTRSRKLQLALDQIVQDIRGGSTLRDAVAKHNTIFSNFWISLIEMGEASGQLTRALEQIAIHLEKSSAVQRKVISALFYPVILVIVAVCAILGFLLFIIPNFANLYGSMNAELPALTRWVLAASDLLQHNFLLGFGGLALGFFLFKRYAATPHGRWQLDKMSLRLPLFGPLFQAISAQEVTSNLSTLLKAGVPILHALDIVISGCRNKVVASVIEYMRTGAREGRPLAEPLSRSDVFPPMVAQMIAVGEQTGKLPTMLTEAANFYEEQVSTTVERMMSMLEPIMLIVMGVVVGVLLISMYLPIINLSNVF